jgi:hypothetical protein
MYQFFSKEECSLLLSNESEWQLYDQDFKYYQKFIKYNWLDTKLKSILHENKKISVNEIIETRIIKLSKGYRLPTHTFNYSNQKSLYRHTTFTVVIFLNEDFIGGNFYFNNVRNKMTTGYGVIHGRSTNQQVSKIEEGECYLLFSHFGEICVNKPF